MLEPPLERFIPYGRPDLDEKDIAAVLSVLKGDFLTTGPKVIEFEQALETLTGGEYALSCSSGTAALHLACLALNISEGDQVIVPAMTFCATANVVAMCGGEVIFSDVDPKTGLMRDEDLRDAIGRADKSKLSAVIVVHMNGQVANMPQLQKTTEEHGLKLIEDACHALGSSYKDTKGQVFQVGSCAHSDLCCFSFHPVKTVAMGEGGTVMTNSEQLKEALKSYRNHGLTTSAEKFIGLPPDAVSEAPIWHREMQSLGYNYRAPDILCALALSQLEKLAMFKEARRCLVEFYNSCFAGQEGLISPLFHVATQEPCWHLYPVFIDFEALGHSREEVMGKLRDKNIGTQVHYMPVPWHPYWKEHEPEEKKYSGAVQYYNSTLSLPLYVGLAEIQVKHISRHLVRILSGAGK